jgi:hypothetical protein
MTTLSLPLTLLILLGFHHSPILPIFKNVFEAQDKNADIYKNL